MICRITKILPGYPLFFLITLSACTPIPSKEQPIPTIKTLGLSQLGKQLFFDTRFSIPAGQSCASCHDPETGFADPNQQRPFSEGAVQGRFGHRNAPSIAYAAFTPDFYYDASDNQYFGGFFRDGRAQTLERQASGPLFSSVEMHANPQHVLDIIEQSSYKHALQHYFG